MCSTLQVNVRTDHRTENMGKRTCPCRNQPLIGKKAATNRSVISSHELAPNAAGSFSYRVFCSRKDSLQRQHSVRCFSDPVEFSGGSEYRGLSIAGGSSSKNSSERQEIVKRSS